MSECDQPGIFIVFGVALALPVLERAGNQSYVIVFDPAALPNSLPPFANLRVCASPKGAAQAIAGMEMVLGDGVEVVGLQRTDADDEFMETVTVALKAMRTNLVSTLALVEDTTANMLANLPAFVRSKGIADLRGRCKGLPAVCVAAGPSLARNVHMLKGREDEFVIIAAQTVLKPLLRAGVRPHYVTALDYHELSGRFYEGLTAADVEGVELVVMPTVHPIVPERWPGVLRVTGDAFYDYLLGEDTIGQRGVLPGAGTVAHMSHHLARYMGCDPVALIGQDLGFTDGAYYGKGAAIHQVWSGELSEFNTLEMMEWQRIARNKRGNKPVMGQNGRRMYTDLQMLTYLEGFNAMFRADTAKGLTTIDATEGGSAKATDLTMTLGDVLAAYGGEYHFLRHKPAGARPDGSARRESREAIAGLLSLCGA